MNDLFELKTEGRPPENDDASATVKTPDPVEKASGQGVECRHGGPDHDQPVCDARQLSLPERTNLVEVSFPKHHTRLASVSSVWGSASINPASEPSGMS